MDKIEHLFKLAEGSDKIGSFLDIEPNVQTLAQQVAYRAESGVDYAEAALERRGIREELWKIPEGSFRGELKSRVEGRERKAREKLEEAKRKEEDAQKARRAKAARDLERRKARNAL